MADLQNQQEPDGTVGGADLVHQPVPEATIGSSFVAQPVVGTETAPMVDRPGRALLGWMSPDAAVAILHGNSAGIETTASEQISISSRAAAVRSRPVYQDPMENVIEPIDESLTDHVAALVASPAAQPYFAEGWRVVLADLSRVCAFQSTVLTDHAAERMSGVKIDDMVSIASVTLPIVTATPLSAQFDHQRQAFIVTSANPNLRVLGAGVGHNPSGSTSIFFEVSVAASYVQVVEMDGRYFLRDGYHRAVALVARGVRYAPVFFHRDLPRESLIPAGMLPHAVYAGSRPPLLTDFMDDSVSCDVRIPAVRKLILVQANELTVTG